MGTNPQSNLQTIVEEMMNSSSGIRWDAGASTSGARSPYIAWDGVIIPAGKRAIQLVNLMPLGFKFSISGVPSVNTAALEGLAEMQAEPDAEAEALAGNVPGHPGINRGDKRTSREYPEKNRNSDDAR